MMDPRDIAIWIAIFIVAMIPIGMALWALCSIARRSDEISEEQWKQYQKEHEEDSL